MRDSQSDGFKNGAFKSLGMRLPPSHGFCAAAATSAADWVGDRQMFLQPLRAKDAQFDNLSVEFRKTQETFYSPLMEWVSESQAAGRWSKSRHRVQPPLSPARSTMSRSKRLTVRGPETTLEGTHETERNGEPIRRLSTSRSSNATGAELWLDSMWDLRVFHYYTCPADQFGLLVERGLLDEFCFGVGYGKRILTIDGIELIPDAAVVDATMPFGTRMSRRPGSRSTSISWSQGGAACCD